MTSLGTMDRKAFTDIFEADLVSIQSAVTKQIESIWAAARMQILKEKGHDVLIAKKAQIDTQIEKLQEEQHQIEQKLTSENLTKQQVIELGGKIDTWGQAKGASFFGIPIVSQFEYQIVQLIKKNIDLESPAKFLYDLSRSCMRELTMVGTFEDAKLVYEKFYGLDFRKYGVDIPPRLAEIKKKNPLLQAPKSLQLENKAGNNE